MPSVKKICFIAIEILIICVTTHKSQSTISKCACDLSINSCDINCFCDPKCTLSDLASFVSRQDSRISKKWCIPQSVLFKENTEFQIDYTDDFMCVKVNESLASEYQVPDKNKIKYSPNQVVDTAPLFISQLNTSSDFFTNLNNMWLLYNDNNLGYLTFPRSKPEYFLQSSIPIKYDENITSSYILSDCTKAIGLDYFTNLNFKILKNPNSLIKCYEESESKLKYEAYNYTNCSDTFLFQSISCSQINDSGSVSNCDFSLKPTISSKNCINLMKSVTFVFAFKPTTGIQAAKVDIQVGSTSASNHIEQVFQVYFVEPSLFASFDYNQKKNKNPGYDIGEPIKAYVTQYLITRTITYLKPDKSGKCVLDDDTTRGSVEFLKNVQTECIHKVNAPINNCSVLQDDIEKIILGQIQVSFFSKFSDITYINSKLIQIERANDIPKPTENSNNLGGICKGLTVGLTVQIAYALNDDIDNPIASVEHISYKWDKIIDVNKRCLSQKCTNSNEIGLPISTRVLFVDVSKSPLYLENKMKRAVNVKPGDIFFPLIGQSNVLASTSLQYFSLLISYFLIVIYKF